MKRFTFSDLINLTRLILDLIRFVDWWPQPVLAGRCSGYVRVVTPVLLCQLMDALSVWNVSHFIFSASAFSAANNRKFRISTPNVQPEKPIGLEMLPPRSDPTLLTECKALITRIQKLISTEL